MSIDLHTLSGAYALDALSDEERSEFERHLEQCSACRDEVRELREAAARMGAGMASRPSTALRSRVLAAAEQQPQLRPRVAPIEAARSRRVASRRLVPRLGAVAAAVVLILGVGVAVLKQGSSESSNPPVAAESVSQVFSASDARTATWRTSNGGKVKVATSAQGGQMAVVTRGLPEVSRHDYQLWAMRNGKATSVAVIRDLKPGTVTPIPSPGTTMAITIEPDGGSRQPTTKPIITVDPESV